MDQKEELNIKLMKICSAKETAAAIVVLEVLWFLHWNRKSLDRDKYKYRKVMRDSALASKFRLVAFVALLDIPTHGQSGHLQVLSLYPPFEDHIRNGIDTGLGKLATLRRLLFPAHFIKLKML